MWFQLLEEAVYEAAKLALLRLLGADAPAGSHPARPTEASDNCTRSLSSREDTSTVKGHNNSFNATPNL